ncbi:TOMM precursor leader peptide-binding protein [Streptomyces sp. ACA25]|uniref:TOMM precursor leader peptide-binding protein n=1 Tax=Streptomyces sp. ACA25 TaxID=3022596 RepID=UPI0023075FEE|nr:TOMM precursor leader peptide-binding protein [Streptomyces sp. ACA25]MDB1089574.1 TOMM precursor leader peptide-binding protein [Streptomyces sp. ACA25]
MKGQEDVRSAPRVGFRRHLRVEVLPGEAVYLLSEPGVTVLHGRDIQLLAPLLDGTRTVPELLAEASALTPARDVGRLLGTLARAGLIGYRRSGTGAVRAGSAAAAAYWELAGLDGNEAGDSVTRTPVRIISVGRVEPEQARAACVSSGLTVTDAEGPAPEPAAGAFSLVLCDDYLAPELERIDAWHRARRRPWLLASPGGSAPWVGPVFHPAGACWSCLAHRLRAHRRSEIPVQQALALDRPVPLPDASLAAGQSLGMHAAALETAKWLAGLRGENQQTVTVMDTLTLRTVQHRVQQRPQCPRCGDPGLVQDRVRRPVVLRSVLKLQDSGNNHRAVSSTDMQRRYGHLVSPVTGIISGIRRDTRLPAGLNSYVSGHNLALGTRTLAEFRGSLRSLSGGKGATAEEAEVGALCEAVERYSATRQGDEPTVHDTMNGIGEAAVHPNACQLFAQEQFRNRQHWNTRHSTFQQVCAPFAADRPVDWTPVWSVSAGRHRMLPTSLLYFPGRYGTDEEAPQADSNGNAAGGSLEDAVVQGFLELVERDAVALWWYNRTRHPAVDLDAFDAPWLAGLREDYSRINRELWVLDLTSDLGIPAMAAVSRRTDKPAEDISLGFGAHYDPRLALRRAVTEMSQLTGPVAGISHSDPAAYPQADPELLSWWTRATVRNQPYLLPDPAESPRPPAHWSYTPRRDLRADIRAAENLVTALGSELLVLDQTQPDIGLPVAKVLVPGLRHFWARFAPGRLFDVPVRLGRLASPTDYHHLNPIPLFA